MTRGGLGRIAKRRWVGRARITPAGPPCSLLSALALQAKWGSWVERAVPTVVVVEAGDGRELVKKFLKK